MKTLTLFRKLLLVAAAGVCAFALRLAQNATGFEASTGLAVPGNVPGLLLILWLLIGVAISALLARSIPKSRDMTALHWESKQMALPAAGSLLMLLAGLADIYEGVTGASLLAQIRLTNPGMYAAEGSAFFAPKLQLLLGILGLASGIALLLFSLGKEKSLVLVVPVMLVFRLALTYRLDSINPVLESFYLQILALAMLTLGFFQLASLFFGAGRGRWFCFWGCLSVIVSCGALADQGLLISSLLLYAGGAVALFGFLLICLTPVQTKK